MVQSCVLTIRKTVTVARASSEQEKADRAERAAASQDRQRSEDL